MGVELMKASAGSGKTYALAREYIRLLLTPEEVDGRLVRDPYAYRHILAVTFTNKATGEMKSRIIDELDTLASYTSSSDYRGYLMEHCKFASEAELQRDARRVLTNILNDYGSFHVSTIDSFFQQTIRAFAREIGQVAEYQVELDRDSLIDEASDRVLDSLSEGDSGLLRWLSASTIEKMEDGHGFDLEGVIREFARGYMSDGYKTRAEAIGLDEKTAFSEENLKKLRSICRSVIDEYDGLLKAAVAKIHEHFDPLSDLAKNLVKKIESLDHIDWSGTLTFEKLDFLERCAEDGSKCFVGKKAKAYYGETGAEAAAEVLREFFRLCDDRLAVRNTAWILEGQVYVFRVAEALKVEFDKLLKEKNVLSLNDTNSILRGIIGETEIPFVYEKLGVRLRHFLLDEFQDTAVIQWENFMPLLRNSISDGCYNLIVGDVKQSIYRWRDTDWRILDRRVGEDLDEVAENPLDTNWRSAANIVEFNNDFYRVVAAKMDSQLAGAEGSDDKTISRIYKDVGQKVSGAVGVDGCVQVEFCDAKSIAGEVIKAVLDARSNKGFELKDIAVIVRTNNQGGEVASALIDAGIAVVTNDSLRISSSEAVRAVVARLYRCDDPEESTFSFYAGDFDPATVDGGGSILSLSEELFRGVDVAPGDTSYVLAFLDLVREFEKRNGNSLGAFLKYWEKEGVLKSISSPEGSEAVTVITIHKVKGLDYPCVVFPFPGPKSGALMKPAKHWISPDLEGSKLEVLSPSLYHVDLSEKPRNDLFQGEMLRERRMSYIDSLNLWYVATTRASQMMYLIAPGPTKTLLEAMPAGAGDAERTPWPKFGTMAEALYIYASLGGGGLVPFEPEPAGDTLEELCADGPDVSAVWFRRGELPAKWVKEKKAGKGGRKPVIKGMDLAYVSYPQGGKRGQLKMSDKAREFFFPQDVPEGETCDSRRHGTLVHSILENVNVPSDLRGAIDQAVYSGLVEADEAMELESWLAEAVASVEDRGWFAVTGAVHRNERSIYDPVSGELTRPDRVVVRDGRVEIIDYKTGRHDPAHKRQVAGYMESYRNMGYSEVSGYIWYIGREVVEVL